MLNDTEPRLPIVEPTRVTIPGVEFRSFRSEADCTGIRDAIDASVSADGIEGGATLEEVTRDHASATSGRNAERDAVLAVVDGRIVGYGRPSWYEELPGKRIYCIISYMVPEFRGKGIWRRVLRHCEKKAAEIAAAHPSGTMKILQSWSSQPEVDWPDVLGSEGYREVRHFWDMVRPIGKPIEAGPLPAGLELRSVGPGDLRAVWEAEKAVAPDHWQYRADEWTEDAFSAWRDDNASGAALWQVAFSGTTAAGMVRASVDADYNARTGRRRGMTEHVFVRREWRGKGLATRLLAGAIESLRAAGMDEAFLGVDEENPSGAKRLYESLGYAAVRKDTWHRKWLERPGDAGDIEIY